MIAKQDVAETVRTARIRLGLSWARLAEAVGRPVAWTTVPRLTTRHRAFVV
jgi:cyanate lyase